MINKYKKAFTLAEVLVTIAILGVVAAIILSNTVRNVQKNINRSKIKKAMAVYATVIDNIATTQRLYTAKDLNNYANNDGNCTNIKSYFKIAKSNGKCVFQTFDGVFWNFTKANNVIVAFKEQNLTSAIAYDINNYDAFYFVTSIQDNIVKVNALNYSTETLSYADIFDTDSVIGWGYTLPVRKLWSFLGEYEFPDYSKYSATCTGETTISCTKCTTSGNDTTCNTYNENGTRLLSCVNFNSSTGKCKSADVNGYHCYNCDKYGLNGSSSGYTNFSLKEGFKVQVGINGNGIMKNDKVSTIMLNDYSYLQTCDVNMKCKTCYKYGGGENYCDNYKKTENGKTYYSPY